MPRVGRERFPYTRQGQKQARRYGRQTGQPVRGSGGGYGGGTRGNNPMYSHSPGPVRPSRPRPGNAIGRPPRSLPPVPGRGAAPRTRGLPVGPGTTNAVQRPKGPQWSPGPSWGLPNIGPGPNYQQGWKPSPSLVNPKRTPRSIPGRRGGSRVMGNPGLSGRARKSPGVGPGGPGRRRKGRTGGGY
jgi:hypothetical protein